MLGRLRSPASKTLAGIAIGSGAIFFAAKEARGIEKKQPTSVATKAIFIVITCLSML